MIKAGLKVLFLSFNLLGMFIALSIGLYCIWKGAFTHNDLMLIKGLLLLVYIRVFYQNKK